MYNMKISNDVSRYTKFEVIIIMPVVRLPLFVAVAVRVVGAVAGHRSPDVLEREKKDIFLLCFGLGENSE